MENESTKFKPGDRVRIIPGGNVSDYAGGWNRNMDNYVGRTLTLKSRYKSIIGSLPVWRVEETNWVFDERYISIDPGDFKIQPDFDDRMTIFFGI